MRSMQQNTYDRSYMRSLWRGIFMCMRQIIRMFNLYGNEIHRTKTKDNMIDHKLAKRYCEWAKSDRDFPKWIENMRCYKELDKYEQQLNYAKLVAHLVMSFSYPLFYESERKEHEEFLAINFLQSVKSNRV